MEKTDKGDVIELHQIGERMKRLRIAKGYTNYENFAFENNIPRAQYGRYENGANLTMASFLKVLKKLEVSPEEFFGGIEKKV